MNVKSVIAASRPRRPAHGPMITLICGITPGRATFRSKM
jgi:hypothetical protein